MSKVISFIIPSYNVEPYLRKCLEAFWCPAVRDEVEVLIVDDGSTDRTAEIARGYMARDPDMYRLLQKENGGHGSAINAGARIASGKYFKVIDADDWIIKENLPLFVEKLRGCEADVVLTPFHQIHIEDGSQSVWRMYCAGYERSYSLEEITKEWNAFKHCLTFHGITYRTDFYRKFGHKLPENIYYEDQEFASIPCCHAASVWPLKLFLYQYRVGDPEQSVSVRNRIRRLAHVERVTKDMLLYRRKHEELSPAAGEFLYKKTESVILSYYVAACILMKNRVEGRRQAGQYTRILAEISPEIYRRIFRKYKLYVLMSRLHVPERAYRSLLDSRLYGILRMSHRIEKE